MSTRSRQGRAKFTRAEVRIQKTEALEQFLLGATERKIAEELGVSQWTARKRVVDALEEMKPHADVDRYRARQIAENEVRRRRLMRGIVSTAKDQDWTANAALNRALTQLHEREARALNLDKAPTEWERFRNMSDADLEAELAAAEAENPDAADAVANA